MTNFSDALVPYPSKKLWNLIPIGIDEQSEPVILNLKSSSHTLIAGGNRSGKSNLFNVMVSHCIESDYNWRLYGLDLKEKDLQVYSELDITERIAFNREEGLEVVNGLLDELHKRYEQVASSRVSHLDMTSNFSPILFLIDDINPLGWPYGKFTPESSLDMKIMLAIENLARLGSVVGIHLMMQTRRFDDKAISSHLMANFANRIALGHLDRNFEQQIFQNLSVKLYEGEGRGYIQVGENGKRFKKYWISAQKFTEIETKNKSKKRN